MKNFKHYLIKKLLKWSKILDIEKALRDKYHEGCAATEKKYAGKVNVWFDPTVRVDSHFHVQPVEPKSAIYEPPEKQTDPYGAIHQQLAQRRDMMHAHNNVLLRKNRLVPPVIRTNTEPIDLATDPPDWLVGINDPTAKVPAIKKRAYQEYQKRRVG